MTIAAQLEHDQLTPSGLMVFDHHPADPDRQNHRRCVGLSFAQVRPGDRVVAINADTAFGTLGARVDTAPRSP